MLDITNFPWAECVITENRNLYISDALSGSRNKRNMGKHRYELELTTHDMALDEGMGVIAQLSAAVEDDLTYVHPRLSYSKGVIPAGGLVLSRTANKGEKFIYVTNATAGQPWQLKAGDFLNIGSDSKVYQSVTTTTSNVGERKIDLTHRLRFDIASGQQVLANGVTWTLVSDGKIEYEMVASDNQDVPFTLIAVEKI